MAQALQIDALASDNSVDPRASLEQKILIDQQALKGQAPFRG